MTVRKNSKRYQEFKEILDKIPQDKKQIGERLVEELLFMRDTLEDLKNRIREDGTVERFVQGKQNFMRESPALKSYNTTVNRYSQLYKQLTDLLPKMPEVQQSNALYDFLKEE